MALMPQRPKARPMTLRTPSVSNGRPHGGRRLIKSKRWPTVERPRCKYAAKARATREGKGKSRSRRCPGLSQSHGQGPPVHVVQGQCGHFVGTERQLRETQRDGVVAPTDRGGTTERAQKPKARAGIQNMSGRWGRWGGGTRHGTRQSRTDPPCELQEPQETS